VRRVALRLTIDAASRTRRVSVVEYSARTGQRLADVMPAIRTPYAGPPCVPLWTDPSGERYDSGRLSRVTLHPPMDGMNIGALFAW
jgi:hypothetical protein